MDSMKAMVLAKPGPVEERPLEARDMPVPEPGPGEVLIRVEACGVCRTDLHVVEGELPPHRRDVVPGHEVVGRVERLGPNADEFFAVGDRAGVAWLNRACGQCAYCLRGAENLCADPRFTGYDADGGYAEYVAAPAAFAYRLPEHAAADEVAPFLCAGIIGYRALVRSDVRPGEPLGLYGFGASAHLVIQIAGHWGCPVYVCTRDEAHQRLAREMGAVWVGGADAVPPVKLRSAILFAPVGDLVPAIMRALDRGGTLAIAGIYLTPIPGLDYDQMIFNERCLKSVTANTREDGRRLLQLAEDVPLHARTTGYGLEQANEALQDLKHDRVNGAAVLRVSD